MFLEMTDHNKNEMILYSENKFNPDENFKIIFKDQFSITEKRINYSEAFNFLHYPLSKNIILYRLITNYDTINSADSKFGFVLFVDGKEELFYFDPIYALKDLPNLVKDFNLETFRFRIQQVGIKTIAITELKENFKEIYCYDLHAVEAQHQNDKIFADALFQKVTDKQEEIKEHFEVQKEPAPLTNLAEPFEKNPTTIKEVEEADEIPVSRPKTEDSQRKSFDKSEQKELLKKVLGIDSFDHQEPLKVKVALSSEEKIDFDGNSDFSNLFRTTRKSVDSADREKDSITLKFTKFQ